MRQANQQLNSIFRIYYISYITPIILSLSISIISSLSTSSRVSALDYGSNANIQFTFNPTISMNLSSSDLVIPNLSPGSYADSNIITISVDTNNSAGYTLSATVGNSIGNSGNNNGSGNGRNSTDLVNISNSNYKFTSLSSNAATLDTLPSNTWGYSYSTDNGTTWISGSVGNTATGYNGLSLDNNSTASELGKGGVSLLDYNTVSSNNSVKFKIGAKADAELPAGTYTNTINFYAVTKTPPISITDAFIATSSTNPSITTYNGYYAMQDMSPTICNMTQTIDEDSQTQLIDIRDNKIYWVAKLQDGNCWMTQNLDLDLTSGVALTSETTDLNTYGTAPYVEGYTISNGIISWTPQDWISMSSTGSVQVSATTRTPNASGKFDDWINGVDSGDDAYKDGYIHPLSANPGDWYETGTYFNSPSCNYLSGSCSSFSQMPFSANSAHGHVGNYYNWTAAIASNDSYSVNSNSPQNSICPKNWILPINGKYSILNDIYNDGLAGDGAQGRDRGLFVAPLYLVRAGGVGSNSLGGSGFNGHYWLSMAYNSAYARTLNFGGIYVYPANDLSRWNGFSVRCLAK